MDVDYFVITALPVESEALFDHLPEPRPLASTGYWIADIKTERGEISSVLMYRPGCGQGTNAANTRTSYTIARYHPRVVLLVGIAGGFDEHGVCLGDVLVPEFIDPYELAKVKPEETKRRHPPETVTAGHVIEIAKALCPIEWYKGMKNSRPSNRERDFPEIQCRDRGVVGSGDKNLADRDAPERQYLKERHEDRALGFEMEAAGVASACRPEATPYAVIKAVQDNGTLDKDNDLIKDKWREYSAEAAAHLTVLVIQKCSLGKGKDSESQPSGRIAEVTSGDPDFDLVARFQMDESDQTIRNLRNPARILACLGHRDLAVLYTARDYLLHSKFGTLSAALTPGGEAVFARLVALGLLEEAATRRTKEFFENLVWTGKLTELGKGAIDANDNTPIAELSVPRNLRHLSLFDLEVADDLSWHAEFATGVTRLRRNKLWPTLLDPLVRGGLYKLVHDTDKFISTARMPLCNAVTNVMATISLNKSARQVQPLTSQQYAVLKQIRQYFPRARLPYVVFPRRFVTKNSGTISLLISLELICTNKVGVDTLVSLSMLGSTLEPDGTFSTAGGAAEKQTLWVDIRPIDE